LGAKKQKQQIFFFLNTKIHQNKNKTKNKEPKENIKIRLRSPMTEGERSKF
jgi:hypothetical protein